MPDRAPLCLFDIDGTLIRTKGAGRAATALAMAEVFGTAHGIEAHVFSGKTDWQTLVELLEPHGKTAADIEAIMPMFAEVMGRHLAATVQTHEITTCPGALETVMALVDRGVPLGIVTGNVLHSVPVKLRAGGFDPAWFPVGAYGSEAHARNDLPRLAIDRAEAYYGRTFAPHEVIVIGDTSMDIACAREVGAVAVAVMTGFGTRDELTAAAPDVLLNDLTTFMTTVAANW